MAWSSRRDRTWRRKRREFIYLDEVSVTSLLAARDGAIPETMTERLSRTAESESRLSVSAPIRGVKLGVEARSRAAETTAHEVVRRAVIQSTFRELRTGGSKDDRPFGDPQIRKRALNGSLETVADIKRKKHRLTKASALRSLDSLERGDVIELDVTLRPDPMFSIVSGLESILEIVEGRPELFGDVATRLSDAAPMAEVLHSLMVGLVPIHGVSTQYALIDIEGTRHIIDTRTIKPGSALGAAIEPLELVAVTEAASYWKDLRQVLYTENRHTVYARVSTPSLQINWNPLKLAGLMRELSDEMGDSIEELSSVLVTAFKGAQGAAGPALDVRVMMHDFAAILPGYEALEPGAKVAVDDAVTHAVQAFNQSDDLTSEREAFDIVATAVEMASGSPLDRVLVAKRRVDVRQSADARGIIDALGGTTVLAEPRSQLEVEVVAIYW